MIMFNDFIRGKLCFSLFQSQERPWPDKQWGLCIWDDVLEHCGQVSKKRYEDVYYVLGGEGHLCFLNVDKQMTSFKIFANEREIMKLVHITYSFFRNVLIILCTLLGSRTDNDIVVPYILKIKEKKMICFKVYRILFPLKVQV